MVDAKQEESQAELFKEFSDQPKKPERFPSIQKAAKPILVSTSMEQVIFCGILLILTFCLIFFLGVLRGRSLSVAGHIPAAPVRVLTPRPVLSPSKTPSLAPGTSLKSAAPIIPLAPSQTRSLVDLNKPYTIQLVTYKKKDLAEKDVSGLRQSGFYSFIIPSGDYFQVCVGQYASKDQAKQDLRAFGGKHKDCFLRRR